MRIWCEGEKVYIGFEGERGADIFIPEKGIIEGKPFRGTISLSVSEFIELLYSFYFDRDYVVRRGNLELKKGKSEDVFLKFTDYSKLERSILYIKDLESYLEKFEKVKKALSKKYVFHDDLFILEEEGELELASPSYTERYRKKTVLEIIEIFRFGAFTESGYFTYGAGRLSILKPDGELRFAEKVYPQKTYFVLTGKEVPEALAKIYLLVR
ncbi:MAG TPA: hypothetical protein EYH58_07315 [Aquifex aeolicus]|nr:hypothetical protein [Aquifex aeolicus]